MTRRTPKPARSGFTLIELLIAMLMSTIVLFAIYLMLSSSSEVFHHQELLAENNDNTRFATEQLTNDVTRVAFQASPNAANDPLVCPKPSFYVRGIQILEDQTITMPVTSETLTWDGLVVVGNMSSLPPFPVQSLSGSSITVDQTGVDQATFESLFQTPGFVRVTNPDGISQFAKVGSVDGTNGTISLSTSITEATNGSCGYMPMAGENHEVTPVMGYLYRLELNTTGPDSQQTDLVRYLADFSGASVAPQAGTRLVIAEYVVGLDFMVLGVPSAQSTPEVDFETDSELLAMDPSSATTASVMTDVNSRPEAARYLIYRIKTRTRRAIPRRLAVPASLTTNTAEDVYFDLGNNKVAEVRTVQGKIQLPNPTIRGMN